MSSEVGRVIRAAMAAQGITVRQLAEQAGVSTATITRARKGLDIRDVQLHRIAEALGLNLDVNRSSDSAERTPTGTVRARTVTPELVTLLGLPDDVLAGLAPEDLAEIDAEAALVILRTARERRGRTI